MISPNHPLNLVSTNLYFYDDQNTKDLLRNKYDFNEFLHCDNGFDVIIGNDVWIGKNVLIKGGVKIGDGAVIGMGAVVTKDVPPFSVVSGVPAKIIRYRFDNNAIESLLKIKWWNWDLDLIKERKKEFIDIEKFIKDYLK